MRLRTKRHGIKAANLALDSYNLQYLDLKKVKGEIEESQAKLIAELHDAYIFLAEGLLQTIDPIIVQALEKEIGMKNLDSERKKLEEEHNQNIDRQESIFESYEYIQRDKLVGSPDGLYYKNLEKVEKELKAVNEHYLSYENNKDFIKLYKRHQKGPKSEFNSFLERISGIDWYFRNKTKKVLAQFQEDDMEILYQDYELSIENLDKALKNIQLQKDKIEYVKGLPEEINDLGEEISGYVQDALKELQIHISEYFLSHQDLKEIHKSIRPEAKSMVASMFIKREKVNYYRQMIKEIQKEIEDRMDKYKSIKRVQNIWERYPNGALRGDKRNWLIHLPEQKSASTRKKISWLRTMHFNIQYFDNIALVNYLLNQQTAFLLYDLIARYGNERMPYDGYARKIITEVSAYRRVHGQEKPNYRKVDQWIKDADSFREDEALENAALLATLTTIQESSDHYTNEVGETEELTPISDFTDIS